MRQQALEALRGSGGGRVLVCTDAAARGLDLPAITHVVQADFADNAVDFLHRIGRTARGDRYARPLCILQYVTMSHDVLMFPRYNTHALALFSLVWWGAVEWPCALLIVGPLNVMNLLVLLNNPRDVGNVSSPLEIS